MKIGYNKIWGVLLLLMGGMVCCLTAVYVRLGEETPFYLAGLFWLPVVLGFLFLFRTYVEVNQNYVFVYGLAFGMKRYRVQTSRTARAIPRVDHDGLILSGRDLIPAPKTKYRPTSMSCP